MMNRFVRRLANKHMNIDSEAGFELVLKWLAAERTRLNAGSADSRESNSVALPPEVFSFLEGFEEFVKGVGDAFGEFERVVGEREHSAQIVETELTAKNAELEDVDKGRNGVILRLLAAVKELSPDSMQDLEIESFSSRERVVNLVTVVEKLALEHKNLLKLMEQLFQFSVAIAFRKNARRARESGKTCTRSNDRNGRKDPSVLCERDARWTSLWTSAECDC